MLPINGVSLSKLPIQVQALLQALLWLLCFKWELELELSSDDCKHNTKVITHILGWHLFYCPQPLELYLFDLLESLQ